MPDWLPGFAPASGDSAVQPGRIAATSLYRASGAMSKPPGQHSCAAFRIDADSGELLRALEVFEHALADNVGQVRLAFGAVCEPDPYLAGAPHFDGGDRVAHPPDSSAQGWDVGYFEFTPAEGTGVSQRLPATDDPPGGFTVRCVPFIDDFR